MSETMPLVDMADYVDGVTELKALCGYGLHKTHPNQVSGMFGLAEYPCPYFSNTGISGLGCDGDCACAKCKGVSGLGDIDFSGIGGPFDASAQYVKDSIAAAQQGAAAAAQGQTAPSPGTQAAGEFGQKVNVVTDAAAKFFAALAPAFKKAPRGERPVVEKQPDYATYAVIGGAVIVAGMLAIAVGKSGRK